MEGTAQFLYGNGQVFIVTEALSIFSYILHNHHLRQVGRGHAKRAVPHLDSEGRRQHSSDGIMALPMHWYERSCYDLGILS